MAKENPRSARLRNAGFAFFLVGFLLLLAQERLPDVVLFLDIAFFLAAIVLFILSVSGEKR